MEYDVGQASHQVAQRRGEEKQEDDASPDGQDGALIHGSPPDFAAVFLTRPEADRGHYGMSRGAGNDAGGTTPLGTPRRVFPLVYGDAEECREIHNGDPEFPEEKNSVLRLRVSGSPL